MPACILFALVKCDELVRDKRRDLVKVHPKYLSRNRRETTEYVTFSQ